MLEQEKYNRQLAVAIVLAKAAATVQTKPMNALKVSFTWALEAARLAEANEVSIVS